MFTIQTTLFFHLLYQIHLIIFQICLQAEIWKPLPLLIFGSFALFGGIITLVLPETHNKTLPDSIEDGEKFGK